MDLNPAYNLINILNQENSTAIEEIIQSTNEMNQQVIDMNSVAQTISDLAKSQDELISQFIFEND
jgi:methyl-accepting chemotaxis protein